MNKLTKAGIATAAGIALLMGGAGTLAYWNDEAGLTGGTVQSGQLDLATAGAGTWSTVNGSTTTTTKPAHIVPGDVVTYTQALTLTAVGDNLEVELGAEIPGITSLTNIDVTTEFEVTGGALTAPISSDDVTPIVLAPGTYTVTVKVVVDFERLATGGQYDMNETIDLGDIAITASQV